MIIQRVFILPIQIIEEFYKMAKTDKEMREELARIRQMEEHKKAQDDMMKSMEEREMSRAASRAVAQDKLTKEGLVTDPSSGREISLWELGRKEIDKVLNADVMAYNDFRSAYMSLWKLNSSICHAINHSVRESIIAPVENGITDYVLLPAYDYVLAPLTDKVTNLILGSDDPEVTLPELRHNISFNADNQLVIAPLTRADNIENTGEEKLLDKLFTKGVNMWLKENGYTPTPDDHSKFVDQQGRALDKATFDDLKEDPEHGFATFLRGYSDLQFSPRGP